jgi:hypothetical protein
MVEKLTHVNPAPSLFVPSNGGLPEQDAGSGATFGDTRAAADIRKARLTFLAIQAAHILVIWMFADTVRPLLLGLSGLCCIGIYGWLLNREISSGEIIVSPFTVYLCAAIFVLGTSSIWAAAVYAGGFYEVFMFGRYDVSESLMQGHVLLLLGDWLLIAGYTTASSRIQISQITAPAGAIGRITAFALLLIMTGWALEMGTYFGFDPSGLGNWYKTFANFSGPAGLLMLLYARGQVAGAGRQLYVILIVFCFSLELFLSLRSYMKQATVQILLPVVLYLFSQMKKRGTDGQTRLNWQALGIAAVVGIFVALILFPFNEMRRADSWYGKVRLENPDAMPYLIEAAEGSIPGTSSFAKLHQFPDSGFWSFFERHAYLRSCGWSQQYVIQNGHTSGEFLRDGLVALIPRAVWPDKPMIAAGRKIAVMLGQARDVETATTSTDAGSMAGALYLNYGMPCLIIGMFVNGGLLCLLWSWIARDILINPFAALTAMMLYVAAGRYFASAADGNIAFYITIFVLYLPLIYLTKPLFRDKGISLPRTAGIPD